MRNAFQNLAWSSKIPVVAIGYCHPILGSSSVNALSTVGRGVSFRQTGFIIIPLCLLNVNLLHGLFLFFTAEIALSG